MSIGLFNYQNLSFNQAVDKENFRVGGKNSIIEIERNKSQKLIEL